MPYFVVHLYASDRILFQQCWYLPLLLKFLTSIFYYSQDFGIVNNLWKIYFVRCCIYLTTNDWIKSFLKITIERRAIYGDRLIRFTWPGENSIHTNNDADRKLQVSGRCLILSSDHYVFSLRTSTKVRQT